MLPRAPVSVTRRCPTLRRVSIDAVHDSQTPPAAVAADDSRLLRWIEAIGVFLLGAVLMNFFYAASVAKLGDEIGAPEHDSYYHIAMASMLPEHGLPTKFPWLQFTWFRNQGDDFVSHHVGFHYLLLPFVKLSEWLNHGDALPGGRWAMSAVFGANLLLFHLLLRQRRVPLHWLWIALLLFLPDQFFARQGYVRAIGASLLFMQMILLALFARRHLLAAILIAAYVHLYLGAVMYGPMIVAFFTFSLVVAPRQEREWPWRMLLLTVGGFALGVLTYPYRDGMAEFLWMQVFGSGLSPDIEVGQEWKPYTDAWFLAQIGGPVFIAWGISAVLRMRLGPRLTAAETTLVLLHFGSLALTFKARRFIEYWPFFCLLSAALLSAPWMRAAIDAVKRWWDSLDEYSRTIGTLSAIASLICALASTLWGVAAVPALTPIFAEWRCWLAIMLVILLPATVRIWRRATAAGESLAPSLGVTACGATVFLAALGCASLGIGGAPLPPPQLAIPPFVWWIIAGAYAVVPLLLARPQVRAANREPHPLALSRAVLASLCVSLLALLAPTFVLAASAYQLLSASRQVRCLYDLKAIREMMTFLRENSAAGDVVFTYDWDVFPVFFYHNRHNYFIVGLDPKFTHARDPDLWSRYVKISRGQVPATITLAKPKPGEAKSASVELSDIRTYFHSRFVICDANHRALADALQRSRGLAEFVYPPGSYDAARTANFVVFRMLDASASNAAPPSMQERGELYLDELRPISATQGFGELSLARSVDRNPLTIAGRVFEHGLGSHAPSKIIYEIPEGADSFEAFVGIDDETDKQGSIVASVLLDGKRVFESTVLRGGDAPAIVRVPLSAARRITLEASTTDAGQRFDHVDWGLARFVAARRTPTSRPASAQTQGVSP